MILYSDLVNQYGNGYHVGNKVIFYSDGFAIGYDISTYKNYLPYTIDLKSKVYTRMKSNWRSIDDVYDFMYGAPTIPDFSKVFN